MARMLSSVRGVRLAVALLVGLGLVLTLARGVAGAFIEILWHAETGYAAAFWKRAIWQWGARLAGGALVAGLAFANLRVVARTLGGIQIKRRFGNLEISEQLPSSYVFWALLGTSALLGLWFGAAVPSALGLQLLMLANAEPWGVVEPFLERDLAYYVFTVPVLGSVVTFALVVVFLLFTLATAGYAATGALQWGRGRVVAQKPARVHLGALLALFFVLLGARMWLGRYLLLMDGSSAVQGIFGFTDAQARVPGLQTLAVICWGAAAVIGWSAWRNRARALLATAGTAVVAVLLIGQLYPALVQRFQVEPNELVRETPYIEANLAFTRLGFGLDALERRRFGYEGGAPVDWAEAAAQFAGIPVWSRSALLTTFREVDARFRYYDFADLTLSRYASPEGPVVVGLAVREVDSERIPDRNWQNLHLRERYLAGVGAMATLASERTPEGRPVYLLSGIPPELSGPGVHLPDLALARPQVYYGVRPQLHAVVNPGQDRFLAPDGSPGVPGVDFPSGIQLSSLVRTAALAWRFADPNLLFSREVQRDSRFVFRRGVTERARAVAPFLRYPEAPYPVIHEGRVMWILEGFTGTRALPLSTAYEMAGLRQVNYLRNSVKVVVDAVTGTVDLYRVPVHDPLADTYARAFPGLFKAVDDMPTALREQLRYSRQLLGLQSAVLLQYHQETVAALHGQQDVWAVPTELSEGTTPVPYRAEYGLWRLPGDAHPRFNLSTVFVPSGRQNLTAFLVGRTDERGVPEVVMLDVPAEDQVPGPRQVEALVEQDPGIAQQFALWRTAGSQVWTGHLHLVPAGNRLLYLEPVFLAATADAIPELRRFVVSDGVRVAMAESLGSAMSVLAGLESGGGGPGGVAGALSQGGDDRGWSRDALALLDRAEARLREGDWAGYGEALRALRSLLESRGSPAPPPPGPGAAAPPDAGR